MQNIKTLNSIAQVGLSRISKNVFSVADDAENPTGILVRSAKIAAADIPESLCAIARAGAGTNNIPVDECSEKGIVVFNTPGANANAVQEMTIAGLIISARNIAPAIRWTDTLKGKGDEVPNLVETGKKQFIGPELYGKKLGVIGLGAIGVKVANTATHLGLEVFGYDPFISVDAAWNLSQNVKHCINLNDIFAQCDFISVHVPVTKDTKGLIDAKAVSQMKQGIRILNFARGELVDTQALIAGLKSGKISTYVTDFPVDEIIGLEGVVALPHLGASTPESEDNCAIMAADELCDYLLNGNIKNSVNWPDIEMPRVEGSRICVLHKNVPGMLSGITGAASDAELNIENLVNKSRGEYAYTMLDVSGNVGGAVISRLEGMDGSIKVRII